MDDQQLFQNYHASVVHYLEENGDPDGKFTLADHGDKKIYIQTWESKVPQPTDSDLKKIKISDLEDGKRVRQVKRSLKQKAAFPSVTTSQRNRLGEVENGTIILNTETGKVEVKTASGWKKLAFEA